MPQINPASFPDRDSFIRHLVGVSGWNRTKVASFFGLTDRHVRRLTEPRKMAGLIPRPDPSSTLDRKDIEAMARDYARDPYTTPEEREAAWSYLARGCPRLSN